MGYLRPHGPVSTLGSTFALGGIGRALFYRSACQQSNKGATCLGLSILWKRTQVAQGIAIPNGRYFSTAPGWENFGVRVLAVRTEVAQGIASWSRAYFVGPPVNNWQAKGV